MARALAQRSRVLLADEPVASLDPANAEAVLALLRDLARRGGLAVLVCLHRLCCVEAGAAGRWSGGSR